MIKEVDLGNYKTNFVYYLSNKEVGYITTEEVVDVVNVTNVYVEMEFRKKGIATELMSFIFKKYKGKFMLEVRSKNEAAINLYKKFNFEVIHTRKNYYKDDDALIMEAYL